MRVRGDDEFVRHEGILTASFAGTADAKRDVCMP